MGKNNKLNFKAGQTVWCVNPEEEDFSGYIFLAEVNGYAIVSSKYEGYSFSEQLENMEEESLEDNYVSVSFFHKDKVFATKEEAKKAVTAL